MRRKHLAAAVLLGLAAMAAGLYFFAAARARHEPAAPGRMTGAEARRALEPYLAAQRAQGLELGAIYDPPEGPLSRRQAREGLLMGSFDDTHVHGVLVLMTTASGLAHLKVVRIDPGSVTEVFSYGGSGDSTFIQVNADLTFSDINGDGARDLLFTESDGSNSWMRSGLRVISYVKGEFHDLPVMLPHSSGGPRGDRVRAKSLTDIDGDGIFELLAIDASWESVPPFSHACSPGGWFVLRWNGSAYVDASTRFSSYLISRLSVGQSPVASVDDESDVGGCRVGNATRELIAYRNGGQTAAGWTRFDELASGLRGYGREKLEALLPVLERAIPRP
jgi:hypothetical protein